MVCFDWEEEERDLCLQNFFWDKKSFDSDLNKRMHALQKLERFWYFFFSFSQFVSKIVFGFSFFKALRESCLVLWWEVREWRNKEKRKEKGKGQERKNHSFIQWDIFFNRKKCLDLVQSSPGQESYCNNSKNKFGVGRGCWRSFCVFALQN